jgi:hypothetical protein
MRVFVTGASIWATLPVRANVGHKAMTVIQSVIAGGLD